MMIEKLQKYVSSLDGKIIPQLSVNCVIFGFHERRLSVMVNRIVFGKKQLLVLPGGYVGQRENLRDAVKRIVHNTTGLRGILFKQFAVFGDADRSFSKEVSMLAKQLTHSERKDVDWISKRFVSICYLALVDFRKIRLKPTELLDTAQWIDIAKVRGLAMDHAEIVRQARASLARELPHAPIASSLLPRTFTLPELQSLVECILGRKIDRPNFRRKVLKSTVLKKVGTDSSGKRRPADLYAFRSGKQSFLMGSEKFGF